MDAGELLSAVRDAFTAAGGDQLGWSDPHPDGTIGSDEYSRVSDPDKYRIVTMRTHAWITALTETGLAAADRVADAQEPWRTPPTSLSDQAVTTWLHPRAAGAEPLLLCLNRATAAEHDYLLLGAGAPAVEVDLIPDCGCDACDSGSTNLLEAIDRQVLNAVSGDLVHITLRGGTICGQRNGWTARLSKRPRRSNAEIEALLDDARAGRSRHAVVHGPAWW